MRDKKSENKNPFLFNARKSLGLEARKAAKGIGVNYQTYLAFERMKVIPSPETQERICSFYRRQGVFLFEEEVFPKRITKRNGPKLMDMSQMENQLLFRDNSYQEVETDDLREKISNIVSLLPERKREVLTMLYGIGCDEMSYREVADILQISPNAVIIREKQALVELLINNPELKRVYSFLASRI